MNLTKNSRMTCQIIAAFLLSSVALTYTTGALAATSDCKAVISVNDGLSFNPNHIDVPSSCEFFTVVLRHDGRLPKIATPRNWVLTQDADVKAVVRDAVIAGQARQWLKAQDPRVIAHIPIVGRNESGQVTFATSSLRLDIKYVFLSSLPGQSPVMRGTLTLVDGSNTHQAPKATSAGQK